MVTSNDKPKDGNEEPRTAASGRARQAPRQAPQPVEPRPRRYMVAALPQPYLTAMGVAAPALDADTVHRLLEDDPEVRVRRGLAGPADGGPPGAGAMPFPAIVVAEMTAEHADALRRRDPRLHVERDRLLTHSEVPTAPVRRRPAAAVVPAGVESTFTFLVRDPDGKPVRGATVFVAGDGWPAQAVTGADGRATVTLSGATPDSVANVVVKPRAGFWSRHLDRPALSTSRDNLVELVRLSDTFDGFPGRQVFGWGQQAMHLDCLPPTFRGAGVKIAIIDSGVATRHPDLAGRVRAGADLVGGKADGWAADAACHGTHCAAVIAGADDGRGVVGFAVEAEVHACKIFPGGRFSELIEALDYCIAQRVDVVNLSLGSAHPSPLVAAKIGQAREAGIACVVAAGNDGGPVAFPGTLPTVLTVAAIGKTGTFPPGTSHAAEILEPRTGEGYFSPRFTCHGPEVDVCGPGVAVLSAVPPDAYAASDGTSMAAPHVAGLAALVLAHHPDFRPDFRPGAGGGYAGRDARRVDRLFQIIKSSCAPLGLGDPGRTGAGLPDALRALGPALAQIIQETGESAVVLQQLATEMTRAGLMPPISAPGPVFPAMSFPVTPSPVAAYGVPMTASLVGAGAGPAAGMTGEGAGPSSPGPVNGTAVAGGPPPSANGPANGPASVLGGSSGAARPGRSTHPGGAAGTGAGKGTRGTGVKGTAGGLSGRSGLGPAGGATGSGTPAGPAGPAGVGAGQAGAGMAGAGMAALAWLAEEMRAAGLIARQGPELFD